MAEVWIVDDDGNRLPPGEIADLRALCRAQLGSYKQPREYVFRSEIPLGPAGKVLKREVKASLAD